MWSPIHLQEVYKIIIIVHQSSLQVLQSLPMMQNLTVIYMHYSTGKNPAKIIVLLTYSVTSTLLHTVYIHDMNKQMEVHSLYHY